MLSVLLRHRIIDTRSSDMDKDRMAGMAKQAKGAIKEAAGKVLGDTKMTAEGKGEKAAGKVQNAVGGVKDKVKE
ncbi:CsbD family protein [Komagataeibacter sp. SM21]